MSRPGYLLFVSLLLSQLAHGQRLAIVRPDGTIYKLIKPSDRVNLTYQQTPFLQLSYTGRVTTITSDTLFVVVNEQALVGYAIERLVALQRVSRSSAIFYPVGGAILGGITTGFLTSQRLVNGNGLSSGELFLLPVVTAGVLGAATNLVRRLIHPLKPRKRSDKGWTFRATDAS